MKYQRSLGACKNPRCSDFAGICPFWHRKGLMGDYTDYGWSLRGVLVQTEGFVRFAASGHREESLCNNKGTGWRLLLPDTQGASAPGIQLCGLGQLCNLCPRFLLCAIGVMAACAAEVWCAVISGTVGTGYRLQSSTGTQGSTPTRPSVPAGSPLSADSGTHWGFGMTALYFDSRLHKLSPWAFPVPPAVSPFPQSLPQRTLC